jgi:hypothetical protein
MFYYIEVHLLVHYIKSNLILLFQSKASELCHITMGFIRYFYTVIPIHYPLTRYKYILKFISIHF